MEELQWHLVKPDVLPSLEICILCIFPGLEKESLSPKLQQPLAHSFCDAGVACGIKMGFYSY
jgi:hypothetical protein